MVRLLVSCHLFDERYLTYPVKPSTENGDPNSASEPLLFNGFSSARENPAGYEEGRNSVDGFDYLLPEGHGAKSTLMAGIANVCSCAVWLCGESSN